MPAISEKLIELAITATVWIVCILVLGKVAMYGMKEYFACKRRSSAKADEQAEALKKLSDDG